MWAKPLSKIAQSLAIIKKKIEHSVKGRISLGGLSPKGNVAGCGPSSLNRVTLALEADSGFIQWTPTQEGDFGVVIQAADGKGKTATQAFRIDAGS